MNYDIKINDKGEITVEETERDSWLNQSYLTYNNDMLYNGQHSTLEDIEITKGKLIKQVIKETKRRIKDTDKQLKSLQRKLKTLEKLE